MSDDSKISILTIINIVVSLISIAAIVVVYIKSKNADYSEFSELKNNWADGPIKKVFISETCESNNYLIQDAWPGTVTGCDSRKGLRRGRCGGRGRTGSIMSRGGILYKFWRGKPLCAEKYPSYLDLTVAEDANSCPTGTRSCGFVDSLNQVLCLAFQEPCPVNNFEVLPNYQTTKLNDDYYVINADGYDLVFSNSKTDGNILAEFRLEENQPCANSFYKNYQVTPYILEAYYLDDTCKEPDVNGDLFDSSWEKIDSYPISNQYQDNGIFDKMMDLPDFLYVMTEMTFSKRMINLYKRKYIGVSTKCHGYLKSINELNYIQDKLYQLPYKVVDIYSLSYSSLVLTVLGSIAILDFLIFFCCCGGENSRKLRNFRSEFLNIGFFIGCFVCNCIIVSKIVPYKGVVTQIALSESCSGEPSLKGIIESANATRQIYALSIVALVSTLFNLLISTLSYIKRVCLSE